MNKFEFKKIFITGLLVLAAIIFSNPANVKAKSFENTKVTVTGAKKVSQSKVKLSVKRMKGAVSYHVEYRMFNENTKKAKKKAKIYDEYFDISAKAANKKGKKTLTIKEPHFQVNKYVQMRVQCNTDLLPGKGNVLFERKFSKWSNWKTVKNGKYNPKYSFDVEIMNQHDIYDGVDIVLYIKTKLPKGENCLDFRHANSSVKKGRPDMSEYYFAFSDIKYKNNKAKTKKKELQYVPSNIIEPLKSGKGYVATISFETPGKKKINLVYKANDKETVLDTITINLLDYEKAYKKWINKTFNQVTSSTMSEQEKLRALCDYVQNHINYFANDGDNNGFHYIFFISDAGAFWQTGTIDCWGATDIMCSFATKMGLKSEWTYAGHDAHYYATVYINGKGYKYDACPNALDSIITNWTYTLE